MPCSLGNYDVLIVIAVMNMTSKDGIPDSGYRLEEGNYE
ncbi:hypothetical protein ymoll0001_33050 [Yersinia mollaretii ATCC 43969]|uniref:Uncharacterized protein n=1 Tax=Yersinia mollaretii (strain ATCC 43969 / DSM 18520 / CIP 103324 / CNY 7263 / WAIP 204) TaxID=349967 RepID=A0ABP2EEQ3_YERMW|nr:hypothetical protein ymoll0001_33050 [Yersinia mollaretii ATCC 43969]